MLGATLAQERRVREAYMQEQAAQSSLTHSDAELKVRMRIDGHNTLLRDLEAATLEKGSHHRG